MDKDRQVTPASFDTILWCLRATTALQCFGIAGRYLFSKFESESQIYGLLYFDFGLPEYAAQLIDDIGGYGCLLSAVGVLAAGFVSAISKHGLSETIIYRLRCIETSALSFIIFWSLGMAISETVRGDLFARLTLMEEAVRIATPATLLLFLMDRERSNHGMFSKCGSLILLAATSLTFASHGYQAIELYGPFVDLILLSNPCGITLATDQQTAETLLLIIGWIDIALAILIIALRWQVIAIYMAAWGLLTAYSRVTAGGMDAWPEMFIRAANAGAPLTLFFLFRLKYLLGNPMNKTPTNQHALN